MRRKDIINPQQIRTAPYVDIIQRDDNPQLFLDIKELVKASFPIYGGSPDTESPAATTTTTTPATAIAESGTGGQSGDDTSTAAGGDSATPAVELTPEQVADLLKNVDNLTKTNKDLLTENNARKAKEQEAERAKMGREEALVADIEELQQTVVKMDAALRNQAVVNAINSNKDIEWYDTKFVVGKLDPTILEDMQVDLDNGTVTINGIENDLKRIAKENDWAVKKNAATATTGRNGTAAPPRGSGAPPAPPGGSNDKQAKRQSLIEKFPIITHGRR